MKLYRVFPWDGHSLAGEKGGPLYCPRYHQASTRYAIADRGGVLYCSTAVLSAIAERLQGFRGCSLSPKDLERLPHERLSLAEFDWDPAIALVDLNNPVILVQYKIDPVEVATSDRPITQRMSARLFDSGAAGFLWWSSLKASWINTTLFESRAVPHLQMTGSISPLTFKMPEVIEAARMLGIKWLK